METHLGFFLLKVIAVSLSGVMAPGAVTAATISCGSRDRWAGAKMSIGHGIVELPLIALLIAGLSVIVKWKWSQVAIGVVGGGYLLWMCLSMIRELFKPEFSPDKIYTGSPLMTGLVLSATNPYFLMWWATVGLNLALDATDFSQNGTLIGITAVVLFAIVHWLCDLVWLSILSFTSFAGASILNDRNQRIVLGICSTALGLFGIKFIYDALKLIASA